MKKQKQWVVIIFLRDFALSTSKLAEKIICDTENFRKSFSPQKIRLFSADIAMICVPLEYTFKIYCVLNSRGPYLTKGIKIETFGHLRLSLSLLSRNPTEKKFLGFSRENFWGKFWQ